LVIGFLAVGACLVYWKRLLKAVVGLVSHLSFPSDNHPLEDQLPLTRKPAIVLNTSRSMPKAAMRFLQKTSSAGVALSGKSRPWQIQRGAVNELLPKFFNEQPKNEEANDKPA